MHAPFGSSSPVSTAATLPWVPIALLLVATAAEPMRLPGLLALSIGFMATLWRAWREGEKPTATTFVYGACMLVALCAVWSGVALPAAARDGSACATPLAPFALYRVSGAVLVLVAVGLVVRLVGSRASAIGILRSSPSSLLVAAATLGAVGFAATFIGPAVAEPFFGPLPVVLDNPWALLPALAFAVANASMEETVYRGALLRWLAPAHGVAAALAVQAAAFGLAHGVGNDFAGSPVPVVAATALGGLAFGAIALRTGSLVLPIALHAALDIPIYYANACLRA
jgi:membrane protease YdiL (CAAX protease family)